MTWWQSLLIAIVPAIITAFISWLISYFQIRNTKKELKEKYDNENKLHINKMQFDTEFGIYKELSEKIVTMVIDVATNLFPPTEFYEPKDLEKRKQYRLDLFKHCEKSFAEANMAINKYACFIPKEKYEKFISIKQKCSILIRAFYAFMVLDADIEKEIYKTLVQKNQEISEDIDKLIIDLRNYIDNLTYHKN